MNANLVLRQPTADEIARAKLPAQYEAARNAIAECKRIDQAKEWADKSAALAGYFRLSGDETMVHEWRRIQQWALRKAGELLKEIPRGDSDGANLRQHRQVGTHPPVITRTQAAKDAGMSEHQAKQAMRLASVSENDFAVEAGVVTTTELAARGTVSKPKPPEPAPIPADPGQVAEAIALLRQLAAFCGTHDPVSIACAVSDTDVVRGYVECIDAWLDVLVTNLAQP